MSVYRARPLNEPSIKAIAPVVGGRWQRRAPTTLADLIRSSSQRHALATQDAGSGGRTTPAGPAHYAILPKANAPSDTPAHDRKRQFLATRAGRSAPFESPPDWLQPQQAETPQKRSDPAFGQHAQSRPFSNLAYPLGEGAELGAADLIPVKTTSNGSNWVLDPDHKSFQGAVEVPRPKFAPPVMEQGSKGYHIYTFDHAIEGAEKLPPAVLQEILRANAAPNDDLKPATREGSNNDAAYPGPFNQVKSYDRVSSDGQHWVVNVTRSIGDGLHVLSDGWVASTFVTRPDGKVVLVTYGEGDSFIQDPNTLIGRIAGKRVNKHVWNKRAENVQRDVNQYLMRQKIMKIFGQDGA